MVSFESRPVVLALRIIQFVFAIIVLGLEAYVAHWWNSWYHSGSPSQINFLIFCAIWTLLALVFLIVVPWRFGGRIMYEKYVILAVEALTTLFWFAGFVALAVFLSGRMCYGQVCNCAKAGAAFGAFAWLAFAITTAMAVMHVFRTKDRSLDNNKADPNMNVAEGV